MTKYYDIYTQIPGIKPCPQMWVVEEDWLDVINQLLKKRNFIEIHKIVATTAKEQSNTKALICCQEYFICMVESRYEGEHMNKGKRTKQVAKTALNAAIMISFFATFAALIWWVWDQREIASKVVATALIVFVAVWLCKLIWIVVKES